MRLSMWIIKDWLSRYSPEAKIELGERTIQNVRLYSDFMQLSSNTLYLNEIEPGKIMCANQRDILILHASDIEEILNSILDAFDYYNEWEAQLNSLIRQHCSLTELLEFGYTVIKRMILIGDATYYLRSIVGDEPFQMDNEIFQSTLENRILPLSVLAKITKDLKFRTYGIKTFRSPVEDMGVTAALTNLFINRKLVGWLLTQSKDSVYSEGELDIQDAFADILIEWMRDNLEDDSANDGSFAVLDILSGKADVNSIFTRFEILGWSRNDDLRLFTIGPVQGEDTPGSFVVRFLAHITGNAFAVNYQDRIVYLVNSTLARETEVIRALTDFLEKSGYYAIQSSVFHNVMDIQRHYEIADSILHFCDIAKSGIVDFEDMMLQYILSLIQKNALIIVSHPAIRLLRDYDALHSTDYANTLYAFLKNSCSYVDTAEELFIHRSTLLYRMQKIHNLTQLDLCDFPTRVFLSISFLLEENLI